ncbi:serine hydrolase [Enterococcus ureilyticus]|uniref:serine hydrolase n=1 Tax=Enterococcus ureilyticus TaxID=1131292 RepID=UPI001A93246D|nr:serine hydrolase [Enterococcus ureilyticus]MBO0446186.1 serine hydrolase [Enterococcus ureilyticus]
MKRKRTNRTYYFIFLMSIILTVAVLLAISIKNKKYTNQTYEHNSNSSKTVTTSNETKKKSSATSTVNRLDSTQSSSLEPVKTQNSVQSKLDASELFLNAGKVGYGVYYFNEDDYLTNYNTDPFISASVIKVFIMAYIYEKELALDRMLEGETTQELVRRMIQISDNQATNRLIEFLGMDNLNHYFEEQGYKGTKLQRKMLDEQARMNGLENYTSVEDAMEFLKKMYVHRNEWPYSQMLTIMSDQTIRTKLPSKLPFEVQVANKTGELTTVENDIGLVLDPKNPFAIVILTNEVYDSSAMREAIGGFALQAFEES